MQENYIVRNHSLRPNVCIFLSAFIIGSGRGAYLEEALDWLNDPKSLKVSFDVIL
jgi:hypothetical protein